MKKCLPAVALVLLAVIGCGDERQPAKVGAPPIQFSFRKAQVLTKGMVAGIQNTSKEETLNDFVIQVSSPQENGTRSHRVAGPIQPQDSITVGWVELDGWKLKPNDKLSVKCREYTEAATVVVPEL